VLEVLFDGDVEPDDDLIGGGASAFKLRDAYFGAADTAISRDHKNNPVRIHLYCVLVVHHSKLVHILGKLKRSRA